MNGFSCKRDKKNGRNKFFGTEKPQLIKYKVNIAEKCPKNNKKQNLIKNTISCEFVLTKAPYFDTIYLQMAFR